MTHVSHASTERAAELAWAAQGSPQAPHALGTVIRPIRGRRAKVSRIFTARPTQQSFLERVLAGASISWR